MKQSSIKYILLKPDVFQKGELWCTDVPHFRVRYIFIIIGDLWLCVSSSLVEQVVLWTHFVLESQRHLQENKERSVHNEEVIKNKHFIFNETMFGISG